MISGAFLPLSAYTQGTYFTIRSGGMTFITFLFDCVYTWAVCLPIALLPVHLHRAAGGVGVLLRLRGGIIKAVIGAVMLHSGIWARNVVGEGEKDKKTQEAAV